MSTTITDTANATKAYTRPLRKPPAIILKNVSGIPNALVDSVSGNVSELLNLDRQSQFIKQLGNTWEKTLRTPQIAQEPKIDKLDGSHSRNIQRSIDSPGDMNGSTYAQNNQVKYVGRIGLETATVPSGLIDIAAGTLEVIAGAALTQADSPAPGPADAVGAAVIVDGNRRVRRGFLNLFMPASSFEMPSDWPDDPNKRKCKKGHPLHRAVPLAEKEDIEFTHKFMPSPSGSMGKYFFPTRAQSINFAHSPTNKEHPKMWRATGVLPPGIPHDHFSLPWPSEGPAVFIVNESLPAIQYVRVRERIK